VSEPVTEAPELVNPPEVPYTNTIPEANTEDEDSEEDAQDDSEDASQFRRTFRYKSSHPNELIIESKDSPLKQDQHSEINLCRTNIYS